MNLSKCETFSLLTSNRSNNDRLDYSENSRDTNGISCTARVSSSNNKRHYESETLKKKGMNGKEPNNNEFSGHYISFNEYFGETDMDACNIFSCVDFNKERYMKDYCGYYGHQNDNPIREIKYYGEEDSRNRRESYHKSVGSEKQIMELFSNTIESSQSKNRIYPQINVDRYTIFDDFFEEHSNNSNKSLRIVAGKISKFKNDYQEFIQKLDEASLLSAKAKYKFLDERELKETVFLSRTLDRISKYLSRMLPEIARKKYAGYQNSFYHPNELTMGTLRQMPRNISLDFESDPCSALPNFGVVLIKSPSTVKHLWDEYTKLPSDSDMKDYLLILKLQLDRESDREYDISILNKRQTTIQQLEIRYGPSWRNNDKNFSRQINRRKKIWNSIEIGLVDGLSLNACFRVLEDHVKEIGKGLSWYYNGVPFRLSEKAQSYYII